MKYNIKLILLSLSIILIGSKCEDDKKQYSKLDKLYLINLQEERDDRNWRLKYDVVNSPFFIDTTVSYKPLSFYEPSSDYIFKSKLYKYQNPETVEILSTQGDSRLYQRFGYFLLKFQGNEFKLNVYRVELPDGGEVFNIWFKDATNGKETYENGRYLFFTKNQNDDFEYTIDFNRAINPLCAYSKLFNCPIPTSLDSIPFEIKAGEKKF
ncbi:MAG: DUF1684 domain-containing protein [Ignavibacterium sp.]|nr:DUF1684 domain-containing protein [Ignavibacterium sp.]MDW8375686.1 DUF1684 domain-containing protein [Ignavibacteriales bacterium]